MGDLCCSDIVKGGIGVIISRIHEINGGNKGYPKENKEKHKQKIVEESLVTII